MRLRTRFLFLAVFILFAPSGAALAQDVLAEDGIFDRPICEPPISTCRFGPDIHDSLTSTVPVPQDSCPLGFSCTCVPSCPECDDCDAQVCVPDPSRQCETACDCRPGLGCFDNRCIAGFAPVYCCDSDICPTNEQCQARNGEHSRCEDPGDPMCRERVEKISRIIGKLVRRGSRCRADSECTSIDTTTRCRGTCGAFVNKRRAARIERAIDRLDRKICSDYQEDGCPFATPACLAVVLQPACRENRCTGVPFSIEPPRPRPIGRINIRGIERAIELPTTP